MRKIRVDPVNHRHHFDIVIAGEDRGQNNRSASCAFGCISSRPGFQSSCDVGCSRLNAFRRHPAADVVRFQPAGRSPSDLLHRVRRSTAGRIQRIQAALVAWIHNGEVRPITDRVCRGEI